MFCENTGFQREAAEQLGAKVVFMEHRYYGKSVPDKKMTYLSAEQALADFADYLDNLKKTENVGPVIALGGSYGGMLAAYIRIKERVLILLMAEWVDMEALENENHAPTCALCVIFELPCLPLLA